MSYESNRQFGDKYKPAAFEVLRELYASQAIFSTASESLDCNNATDLIMLEVNQPSLAGLKRIAFRVRKPGYVKYGDQFTIRSKVKYGGETEFNKIMKGMADLFLYAHAAEDGSISFDKWMLMDLAAFRFAIDTFDIKFYEGDNGDGTGFYSYQVKDFPNAETLIIARSKNVDKNQMDMFG